MNRSKTQRLTTFYRQGCFRMWAGLGPKPRSHRWNVLQGWQNAGRKDEGRWLGGQVHAERMVCFTFFFLLVCYLLLLYPACCFLSCTAILSVKLGFLHMQDHFSCCQLHHVTSSSIAWERSSSHIIISYHQGNSYLHETHHNCHQEHTHTLLSLGSFGSSATGWAWHTVFHWAQTDFRNKLENKRWWYQHIPHFSWVSKLVACEMQKVSKSQDLMPTLFADFYVAI